MVLWTQVARAVTWTAISTAGAVALGECSKDAFHIDVKQNAGLQLRALHWGLPITFVTNPSALDLVGDTGMLQEASKAVTFGKGIHHRNAHSRCRGYLEDVNAILQDSSTTDGVKLIKLGIADGIIESVLEDPKSAVPPGIVEGMSRVHDRAKDVVWEARSLDDYNPVWYGLLALLGLGWITVGIRRMDEHGEENQLARVIKGGGLIVAIAAGLLAVRSADGEIRVHAGLSNDVCGDWFCKHSPEKKKTGEIQPKTGPKIRGLQGARGDSGPPTPSSRKAPKKLNKDQAPPHKKSHRIKLNF